MKLFILLSFPCMILAFPSKSNGSQNVLHSGEFTLLKDQIELLSQRLDEKEVEIKELKEEIEGQVNEELM